MIEYIKFWLAKEVADLIVFLPLLVGGIAYLIYAWWSDKDDSI